MFGVAETATPADVQRMFEIHVIGPWRLMKLALPYTCQQSEGLIINVTSGYGRFGFPFSAIYGVSKFGLEGLSEGLHYEIRPLGIDVAIIQLGAFPIEMFQKVQFGADPSVNDSYQTIAGFPDKMFNAIGKLFEAAKPDPQDVADAVVKLIGLPKGQRPLRTVVDPTSGEFVKAANDAVKIEHEKCMTAYALGGLLHEIALIQQPTISSGERFYVQLMACNYINGIKSMGA